MLVTLSVMLTSNALPSAFNLLTSQLVAHCIRACTAEHCPDDLRHAAQHLLWKVQALALAQPLALANMVTTVTTVSMVMTHPTLDQALAQAQA